MKSSIDNGLYQTLDLAHFRDIQARTGKPWWFTEIGWSSAPNGADYGGGVGSEQAQASYMIRQYVMSLDFQGLNVEHIFWYNFRNDGTDPNNVENNYGLVQNDWRTPKFSYTAYQQMTAHLSGATAQGTVDSGAGIAYRFNRNGTAVDVVWGGGRTSLPTAATQAQAFDMAGNALPTEVSGGQIHVTIGGDPVFVEHYRRAGQSALPVAGAADQSDRRARARSCTRRGSWLRRAQVDADEQNVFDAVRGGDPMTPLAFYYAPPRSIC